MNGVREVLGAPIRAKAALPLGQTKSFREKGAFSLKAAFSDPFQISNLLTKSYGFHRTSTKLLGSEQLENRKFEDRWKKVYLDMNPDTAVGYPVKRAEFFGGDPIVVFLMINQPLIMNKLATDGLGCVGKGCYHYVMPSKADIEIVIIFKVEQEIES